MGDELIEALREAHVAYYTMMSTAASFGVDPQAAMAERGITIMDYSQAGMRFMEKINEELAADETGAFAHWMGDLRKAAEEKYSAIFKELSGGGLGDDIDF